MQHAIWRYCAESVGGTSGLKRRPLRSPIERERDGERPGGQCNEVQQTAQPSENEAEVVADSGEDDVGGVALGSGWLRQCA